MIPDAIIAQTVQWMDEYAQDWRQDVPIKIHSSEIDPGGAPQWHPEFASYLANNTGPIGGDRHLNPDNRLRLTRAMRAIRKVAVREYEVLYRVMALGHSVHETTAWLNDRSIRGGHPERYRQQDTITILVSGVHKLREWT